MRTAPSFVARFSRSIAVAGAVAILLVVSTSLAGAQDRAGERGYEIELAGYSVDPLKLEAAVPKEKMLDREALQRLRQQPGYYIVQFERPMTAKLREELSSRFGLDLREYIPNLAYLERLDPPRRAKLSEHPAVRAVVPFQPAFKVSPTIGKFEPRTEERKKVEGLLLRAILFPEAEPRETAKQLREIGATRIDIRDDREIGGVARLRFVLDDREAVEKIARLPEVRWIEEVGEIIIDNVNAATTIQSGTAGTAPVWNSDLHGEDQIIGIIDSAPPDINHCFFQDTVDNTPGPAHRKILDIRNDAGLAAGGHATFTAGNAAGDDFNNPGAHNRRGGAWAARLVAGTTTDVDNGTLLSELTAAAGIGARIHTNSWHDNTAGAGNAATYNQNAADVDNFTFNNQDHLVFGSMGNNSEEQGPPGTAKNAVGVNAAQADPNEGNIGDGNPGPTADGRRKPDLVTVGCNIQSATVSTACNTGPRSACATSYATPHAAAAATLVRQYFDQGWYPTGTRQPHHVFIPTGALIKATLVNSTINMAGPAGYPSNQEGWGIVRLDDAMFFPGDARNLRVWDVRHGDGLTTGVTRTHTVNVTDPGEPLRVTLVFSDPPGTAGATNPTVNDLDLRVTTPDGTQTFRGNVFAGGTSTTGGAADGINTVEMVVINNPAAGEWTIAVDGTSVAVGDPGQGYALAATGDFPEPPAPTGDQNLLVVRANFSDVAVTPSLPNLQNKIADVVDYYDEVSYGEIEIIPDYRGPISLDQPRSYYYHPSRSLLVEMTQEVVDKLLTADPDVFDRGTADPADDIDRILVVTNDPGFDKDRATTGPWPYDMPAGLPRPLSVSVHSFQNSVAHYTHGLGHQFGFVDLYAYPGVVFPRAYVDQWDNMGGFYNNVHVLAWQKEKPGWIAGHGGDVTYIPRPTAGTTTTSNDLQLFLQSETGANRKAIALGLSEGAATADDEDVFYMIEARDNASADYDAALPASGVLIYYVNELIPPGEGPVIIRDASPGTATLDDATFGVGDGTTIPGTGITVTVKAGTGGAAYNIDITYSPPATDYNVNITRGDTIGGQFYSYFSPDIWVDSPKNGFNLGGGPPPHEDREDPVIGEVNRIYARVSNDGPGDAFDFDIKWRVSEPYHTVGGEADFDSFVGIKHVNQLNDSAQTIQFVEWTPVDDGDPHSCVRVDLINLVGTDTNEHDNWAQENLREVESITASPYTTVQHRYDLSNPYDEEELFYFRVHGVPAGWDVQLIPRKALLKPGERTEVYVLITPPEDAKVCTEERATIESWAARDHTLVPVGGGVLQVDLRRRTEMTFDTGLRRCDDRDFDLLVRQLAEAAKMQGRDVDIQRIREEAKKRFRDCRRIVVQGCTNPPAKNQEIVVKYEPPVGDPVYRTVKTDANGCYEDFFLTVDEGNWKVSAEYPGDNCNGSVTVPPRVVCLCQRGQRG
ncbi:S8 family serine peptidase [Ferruginivarius sediminum]|uniref:Peptidase S8/S53 domain-containing protein n=1 Tax=Ferruginivarius sediminum TaxID=2661937 RepID=A0A369T9C9_9PROT|nr:S8 family serine peptidase [Ferruginivarius sediminum]RDD61900.1 hypothetical protein DRB17_10435 [Ferruginivarius sediminum]